MKDDVLYIVMPAYNEELSIEESVLAWHKIFNHEGISSKSKLIVADSGSTDSTSDILLRLSKEYADIEVLKTDYKEHGPKLLAMYKYSVDRGADFVFQTDSDGQTNPEEFYGFWTRRHQYDAILGNRKRREDGFVRLIVEKCVCLFVLLFFRVSIPDANAPYRLMKAEILNKYLNLFKESYAIPNIVLSACFAKFDKCCFQEVSFGNRLKGKQKLKIYNIMCIGIRSILDFYRFNKMIS